MCVFENVAPEHGWTLRSAAAKVGAVINSLIQQSIEEAAPPIPLVSTASGAIQCCLLLALTYHHAAYPSACSESMRALPRSPRLFGAAHERARRLRHWACRRLLSEFRTGGCAGYRLLHARRPLEGACGADRGMFRA